MKQATAWDQDGLPLAKGEVLLEPAPDRPEVGRFEPDEIAKLGTLKASASFLSWTYPELWPIEPFEMVGGCSEHLHVRFGKHPRQHPFQ